MTHKTKQAILPPSTSYLHPSYSCVRIIQKSCSSQGKSVNLESNPSLLLEDLDLSFSLSLFFFYWIIFFILTIYFFLFLKVSSISLLFFTILLGSINNLRFNNPPLISLSLIVISSLTLNPSSYFISYVDAYWAFIL